jgi:hypothetical protein
MILDRLASLFGMLRSASSIIFDSGPFKEAFVTYTGMGYSHSNAL